MHPALVETHRDAPPFLHAPAPITDTYLTAADWARIDALIKEGVEQAQKSAERARLLSGKEAATLAGCHRHTIERLGKAGKLSRYKLPGGARYLYKRGELEDALQELTRPDGQLKGTKRRGAGSAKSKRG